jgi:hypothetical protein
MASAAGHVTAAEATADVATAEAAADVTTAAEAAAATAHMPAATAKAAAATTTTSAALDERQAARRLKRVGEVGWGSDRCRRNHQAGRKGRHCHDIVHGESPSFQIGPTRRTKRG